MKDRLLRIINHYGYRHQLKKLQEEVFELQEAIINHENKNPILKVVDSLNKASCSVTNQKYVPSSIKNITEEFADVIVMLGQIKYYYGLDDSEINKIMEQKVDRQLDRMKEE